MKLRLLTAGLVTMLAAAPAFAQFVTYTQPAPAYTGSTTLMAIPGANFSTTSTLTDGTQTLTFSNTMSVRTVPGGGWATWSAPPFVESATPKVLAVTTGVATFTITLSTPVTTFGIEAEPNSGTQPMTMTYFNGATVLGAIPLTVVGSAGARLFAASSATPITSVQLTIPAGAGGFAFAQFRYGGALAGVTGTVPTMSTPALIGMALTLLLVGGWFAARRRNRG